MKFVHLADCHIGGWRESDLRDLSIQSFSVAADFCLREHADFLVIAGDLFNTSVPGVDALKHVAGELKRLQHAGIAVYIIPGSHDYSPSGKTMIDVLEKSGLCVNVFQFDKETGTLQVTVDPKTGAQLTGMVGLRGALESQHYRTLDEAALRQHLRQDAVKIFLFHSLISEFAPVDLDMVDGEPLSSLPKGFDYYAGGHPHFVFQRDLTADGYGIFAYPGPLFPNNFRELEKLKTGGLFLVEGTAGNLRATSIPLPLKRVVSFEFSAEVKRAQDVEHEIRSSFSQQDLHDAIVTVRVSGMLHEGKPGDIALKKIFDDAGAFAVLRNTTALTSREFEDIKVHAGTMEEIERELITSNSGQIALHSFFGQEQNVVRTLMQLLHVDKKEGEKVSDFESRVLGDCLSALRMGGVWGGRYDH